jgi:hypothetical protein
MLSIAGGESAGKLGECTTRVEVGFFIFTFFSKGMWGLIASGHIDFHTSCSWLWMRASA